MPRSVAEAAGAIASTVSPCLPWRKLLSPTEPASPRVRASWAASGAPGVGRAVPASGGRWGGFGRAVESRQRGSEDRGEGTGERQGRAGRRSGPGRQACLLAPQRAFGDRHGPGAGERRPWRAFMGSARRLETIQASINPSRSSTRRSSSNVEETWPFGNLICPNPCMLVNSLQPSSKSTIAFVNPKRP